MRSGLTWRTWGVWVHFNGVNTFWSWDYVMYLIRKAFTRA